MGDDECDLTRGGHTEPERASLAMIVAGNHAIISFFALSYSGFQVLGTPLGALENRDLLCWDLPDRGLHARLTAPATRPLSSISHILLRQPCQRVQRLFSGKQGQMLTDCSATPPKACDRSRRKDWLAAEAPAKKSGAFDIDKHLPLPQNGSIGGDILPEIYLGISIPDIVVSSKTILPTVAGVIVTVILIRNSLN